ncbi:polysaccharide deacetylase family protein [Arcanobacterium hippocoleae]
MNEKSPEIQHKSETPETLEEVSTAAAHGIRERIAAETHGKKKRRKLLWWVLGVLLLISVVMAAVVMINKWIVTVSLQGGEKITLEYGESWNDPGAHAAYQGSVLTFIGSDLPVKISGSVNPQRIGEYVLEYSAQAQGVNKTVQRIVAVKDSQPPKIQLTGGETVQIAAGTQWQDAYTASDNADGDLSAKIVTAGTVDLAVPGDYELKYSVTDGSGNKATAVRKVKVLPAANAGIDPAAGKDKVIYLTFDDGPSVHTARLLDILKARNVQATFFVTGNSPQEMIGREAREGHAVGVHTYTHDYKQIYASDEAFWADFDRMKAAIRALTGQDTRLMRFAGGGSNTVSKKYSPGIMTRLAQQSAAKGYVYFDWNVSSGDASGSATKASVLNAMKTGVHGKRVSIILCHDSHGYTVDAIPEFIDWALKNGYTFLPLTPSSMTAHHPIAN